ncbi:MAG: SDR family NAD(P)-dependent oxidoreductase, partial [Cyanobacteria bacterium P01_H01_bin.153]
MATYLITGANRGIGLEYCKQLHEKGENVIAVCRSSSEALDKLGVRVEAGVDITKDGPVAQLIQKLEDISIDVLINNAGILERISLDNLDFDSIRQQFEVNAVGTLRLTKALLPHIKTGGKVIIMTSRMG